MRAANVDTLAGVTVAQLLSYGGPQTEDTSRHTNITTAGKYTCILCPVTQYILLAIFVCESKAQLGTVSTSKEQQWPVSSKGIQKDTEGTRRSRKEPEGARSNQKEPERPSKQMQTGQAAFAHSSFSSWYLN